MAATAAKVLVLLGALVFGALGAIHLAYTFWSDKLLPRDQAAVDAMKGTTLVLTRQTTIWDAWIGFNASHSLGALLLAVFYVLLAAQHMEVLARSQSLLLPGIVAGCVYVWLAHAYWFRTPFIGVTIGTACLAAAFILLIL